MTTATGGRLAKQLTLFDVYVICTGAMFSSGFFLLPGLAASKTGPSVILAYLLSGLLIVPAMLSQAELATAMPRAGGTYYFLDRTMGPLVGTIGGIGTWLTLMLKSAFALIGMGAYLNVYLDVPFRPLAVGCALVFATLNIVGAKQSSRLLQVLVVTLLSILTLFLIHGLAEFLPPPSSSEGETGRFAPFFTDGTDGLVSTVGLVFVSYIGLTKVASLAEEVKDPERNIPLGMTLGLVSVVVIYVAGVYIMIAALGTEALSGSLTPVADAARAFVHWIPTDIGIVLIVIAAVAAFASMSNAGIMAAARYPLAMARDGLAPRRFARLNRFGSPAASIMATVALMIGFILVLDVIAVAELASALQLLIFALINVAVIVMRESRIDSYDPGFRSPLYPWMQLVGVFFPVFLISEMGWLPVLFTFGVMAVSVRWHQYYAAGRLARDGAIFHVFERLGRRRFVGLDRELRAIMKEKGMRSADPFDHVVARAFTIDLSGQADLDTIVKNAADRLQQRLPVTAEQLVEGFSRGMQSGDMPVAHGAALLHTRLPGFDISEMVLVRCRGEVLVRASDAPARWADKDVPIQAVFFLASGEVDPGRHLRLLAGLAARIEDEGFMPEWLRQGDEQGLKETLLRDERFLSIEVRSGTPSEPLVGQPMRDLQLPEGTLVALVNRGGEVLVPRGRSVLREYDRLTIVGEPAGLQEIMRRYGGPTQARARASFDRHPPEDTHGT